MKFYRPRQIFESEPCNECDFCPAFCGQDMDACMRGKSPFKSKKQESVFIDSMSDIMLWVMILDKMS
jgi:hypothetical protein